MTCNRHGCSITDIQSERLVIEYPRDSYVNCAQLQTFSLKRSSQNKLLILTFVIVDTIN